MRAFRGFAIFYLIACIQILCASDLKPNLTVLIPMRDGVELPTDLYLPNGEAQKAPCILIRCPPGRKAQPWQQYSALSKQGYVVALQDTRSTLDSHGKTFPFFSDGWGKMQDGYDSVEWLAKSPFTNGQIGTFGCSAAGMTQLMMAPSTPPSLKCQYIGNAWGSLYHHGIFPGGQVLKNQVEGWLALHAKDTGVMSHVYNQPYDNTFWNHFNTTRVSHRINVPALLYTGWYDTALQGTIEAFIARQHHGNEGAKGKQKLVIGPWTHYWPFLDGLGEFSVPVQGKSPDIDISPIRWFDYYLKHQETGIDQIPPVTYYVMGPFDGSPSSGNVWRHADRWPVDYKPTPLYLQADRTLTFLKPASQYTLQFNHDPSSPVPTIGGHNLFIEMGPMDQRPIEDRKDVLVFTSATLTEDLEVTGAVLAKMYVHSDQVDTDVSVRLTDVYPDGKSVLIADGLTRIGHKNCNGDLRRHKQPQEVVVDLWSTSIVFAKGHRIRVIVSGSNFPRYEINANTGIVGRNTGEMTIAKNVLHVDAQHSSYILLPVILKSRE